MEIGEDTTMRASWQVCSNWSEAEAYAKSLKVRKGPEDGQLGILAKAQLRRAPMWPIACVKTLQQAAEVLL